MASLPLGQTVRALREAKGLSRERLAARVDVSSSTIRRLEEGHAPKIATLRSIARVLDVSLAELLAEDAA